MKPQLINSDIGLVFEPNPLFRRDPKKVPGKPVQARKTKAKRVFVQRKGVHAWQQKDFGKIRNPDYEPNYEKH